MRICGSCLAVLLTCLTAPAAFGVITVGSNISTDGGIRAQAVITNPTGFDVNQPGVPVTAISIIRINASFLIRDSLDINNGLLVQKHTPLTTFEAWGDGNPLTRGAPDTDDPPFQGLAWPYRDRYDFNALRLDPFDPIGDNVGTFFDSQPGVYGFVNVAGWSRGGPTDPDAGSDIGYLHRGITGMGEDAAHPASYFLFDISALEGASDRDVTLKIFAASAVVVTTDGQGHFFQQLVQIDDFTTTIHLPEPSSMIAGLLTGGLCLMRRRRRACIPFGVN